MTYFGWLKHDVIDNPQFKNNYHHYDKKDFINSRFESPE